MKRIAMILLGVGIIGLVLASMMFGDIGIAAAIGSVTAIVSGIGFLQLNKKMILLDEQK